MNKTQTIAALICAGVALVGIPQAAHAQDTQTPPPISLDLRDAPIRQALEQLFQAAKVQFVLDQNVVGFVNLRITDQPFENALRLILRASTVPLTYTREAGVFIIKVRVVDPGMNTVTAPPPAPETQKPPAYQPLEVIPLVYIDAADLSQVLGVTILPWGLRIQAQGGGGGLGGGGFGGGGLGGLGGGGGFGGGGLGGGFGGGGLGGFGGGGLGGGGFGGGGFGGGGFGGGGLGGGFGGGFGGGGRGF